jgi:hypothetical protein
MQVHRLPHADVAGGNDVRLLVDHEANVTDEPFIEDGLNGLPVIGGSLWESA